MYNIIELPKDENGIPTYTGLHFPNCNMYDCLELTYIAHSLTYDETQIGAKHKSTHYNVYRFHSDDLGDVVYKYPINEHNTFTDSLDLHKKIPGVRYRIRAVIGPVMDYNNEPIGDAYCIYRMVKCDRLTRNPESCK